MSQSEAGFDNFISILLEDENSFEIAQKAFAAVSEEVPLGKLSCNIVFFPDEMIPEKRFFSKEIFAADKSAENTEYSEKFLFGPQEKSIIFFCASTRRNGQFTEEEKTALRHMLAVFYIHLERMRIRVSLKEAYSIQKNTGLPNASGYLEKVNGIYAQGKLNDYISFYFNIKGFGRLNYEFSEPEVDCILKRYADELRSFIRKDELLGHLGGDNFVALVKRKNSDAFLKHLESVITYGEQDGTRITVSLGATVGIYEINENTSRYHGEVIGQAGAAMAYAKRKRMSVVRMTREIHESLHLDRQIYEGLTRSIENGNIFPFYQPKVDMRTGEITGAEALARWQFNQIILAPGTFIPILEKSTRVCELDLYILRCVCEMLSKRKQLNQRIVPISVNFSRRDLEVRSLADKITKIIDENGVDRSSIIVEVTETAYADEKNVLMGFLKQMKEKNIATSVDDFGTGYSSLSVIREYPVSEIKIDRSFINREVLTREDEVVVGSIIFIAHQLGLHVITEGVETKEQRDFLCRLGCTSAQGYLYDPPLSYEEFSDKLDSCLPRTELDNCVPQKESGNCMSQTVMSGV